MAAKKGGGWWSQPVGGGKKKPVAKTPAAKPPAKVKIEKCACGSGKSKLSCTHGEKTPRGTKKEPAAKPTRHGINICTSCGSYEFADGTCRNARCDRHK